MLIFTEQSMQGTEAGMEDRLITGTTTGIKHTGVVDMTGIITVDMTGMTIGATGMTTGAIIKQGRIGYDIKPDARSHLAGHFAGLNIIFLLFHFFGKMFASLL